MSFTDPKFLFFFLPFALLAHRFAVSFRRTPGYGNAARMTIFLLTLVFYGFHEPWWLIPFVFSISMDFLWASLMSRTEDPRRRKLLLQLSIAQNLLLLCGFKYWHLLAGRAPSLPPGISFYTFESMSYVIDVYYRKVTPAKKPQEFFAFIGMFPRLVAGPIVRYKDMVAQFQTYRGMDLEGGLFLLILGLALKVCFADSFAIFVRYAFDDVKSLDVIAAWLGSFCYMMQIYFDFYGYSLMAIGMGRCLGFQFPTNFNRPYLASSLQEFWRRWHISLSTWLRDYLYIPLGGNQHGPLRTYLHLFLTMLIGGAWHGAGFTYLVWGAWHGGGLCLERWLSPKWTPPRTFARAATLSFVFIGWIFFRASTLSQAKTILSSLFFNWSTILQFNSEWLYANPINVGLAVVGVFYCFFVEKRVDEQSLELQFHFSRPAKVGALVLLFLSLVTLFSEWSVPFLYYQF